MALGIGKVFIPAIRVVFDDLSSFYGINEDTIDVVELFADVAGALVGSGEIGSTYEKERAFIEGELLKRLGLKPN